MEVKAQISGRGTNEVVVVGCLPVVTQAHCKNCMELLSCTRPIRFREGKDRPRVPVLAELLLTRKELSNKCHRKDFAYAISDT